MTRVEERPQSDVSISEKGRDGICGRKLVSSGRRSVNRMFGSERRGLRDWRRHWSAAGRIQIVTGDWYQTTQSSGASRGQDSDLGQQRTRIDASTSVDVSDNGTTPTSVVTAGRRRQRRRRQKTAESRSPGRRRQPGELIFVMYD